MAVFRVYADESGIHDGARYCVVAGYAAAEELWGRFDVAWMDALHRFGVKAFHAKRFFGRDDKGKRLNEYSDWDDARALAFLDALTGIVEEVSPYPFGQAVNVRDFKAMPVGVRRYLTGGTFDFGRRKFAGLMGAPSKPYYVPFQNVVANAFRFLPKDGSKVRFMFDEQNVMKVYAAQALGHALALLPDEDRDRIAGYTFEVSSCYSGLQAADLTTHLWYCYASGNRAMSVERHRGLAALTIHGNGVEIYGREQIEADLLAHIPDISVRNAIRNAK